MEGNLTKGPILKTLTKLAIPIMASSFLGTLYNITDMAWIGLLGAKAVAGVGVGGMFTWLSQGLASMARMGGQVQIAQCIGLSLIHIFGKEKVVPIYIEVEDGERLSRALNRERMQESPKYEELCRRFLSDAKDFSGEKLKEAGITRRFVNQDLDETEEEIRRAILEDR